MTRFLKNKLIFIQTIITTCAFLIPHKIYASLGGGRRVDPWETDIYLLILRYFFFALGSFFVIGFVGVVMYKVVKHFSHIDLEQRRGYHIYKIFLKIGLKGLLFVLAFNTVRKNFLIRFETIYSSVELSQIIDSFYVFFIFIAFIYFAYLTIKYAKQWKSLFRHPVVGWTAVLIGLFGLERLILFAARYVHVDTTYIRGLLLELPSDLFSALYSVFRFIFSENNLLFFPLDLITLSVLIFAFILGVAILFGDGVAQHFSKRFGKVYWVSIAVITFTLHFGIAYALPPLKEETYFTNTRFMSGELGEMIHEADQFIINQVGNNEFEKYYKIKHSWLRGAYRECIEHKECWFVYRYKTPLEDYNNFFYALHYESGTITEIKPWCLKKQTNPVYFHEGKCSDFDDDLVSQLPRCDTEVNKCQSLVSRFEVAQTVYNEQKKLLDEIEKPGWVITTRLYNTLDMVDKKLYLKSYFGDNANITIDLYTGDVIEINKELLAFEYSLQNEDVLVQDIDVIEIEKPSPQVMFGNGSSTSTIFFTTKIVTEKHGPLFPAPRWVKEDNIPMKANVGQIVSIERGAELGEYRVTYQSGMLATEDPEVYDQIIINDSNTQGETFVALLNPDLQTDEATDSDELLYRIESTAGYMEECSASIDCGMVYNFIPWNSPNNSRLQRESAVLLQCVKGWCVLPIEYRAIGTWCRKWGQCSDQDEFYTLGCSTDKGMCVGRYGASCKNDFINKDSLLGVTNVAVEERCLDFATCSDNTLICEEVY